MTKSTKTVKTTASTPKPSHKDEATGPSPEVGATSIPPKKGRDPRDYPKIDCTQDQLWQVYMSFPGDRPQYTDMHAKLTEMGIACSTDWVRKMVHGWDFPRKRALAMAGTTDPRSLDERIIRDYLNSLGSDFNPLTTLSGLQMRIIAVLHRALGQGQDHDPDYFNGMMQFYDKITTQLNTSYQKRLANGEIIETPTPKPETGEKVVGFRKKGT